MAQTIVTICDKHLHDEDTEKAGALSWRFGVNAPGERGWTWITIDLCDEDSAVASGFAKFLAMYGRTDDAPTTAKAAKKTAAPKAVKTPEESAASLTCPACGFESTNDKALRVHAASNHNASLDFLRGDPTPYACDICGRQFARAQALGVHRTRAHVQGSAEGAA